MFRNRSFNVKMVKDDQAEKDVVDQQIDLGVLAQDVATAVIGVMGAYFAMSTARGILTHIVVTKIQPAIIVEAVKEK